MVLKFLFILIFKNHIWRLPYINVLCFPKVDFFCHPICSCYKVCAIAPIHFYNNVTDSIKIAAPTVGSGLPVHFIYIPITHARMREGCANN